MTGESTSRVIVVTGATHGLGRALVERFDEAGHVVAACGRSRAEIETLRRTVGDQHRFAEVDVADAGAVEAWAGEVVAALGAPHLFVNNAAGINRNARLWEVPVDEFAGLLRVNVGGPFHCIRAFLPAMIAARRGVVVNVSSTWGRTVAAEVAPYCATKWAIEGMSRALALELPAGLAVVAFNPGVIHTRMLESCFGESAASYEGPAAWSRRAAAFLLSLGPEHNGLSLSCP